MRGVLLLVMLVLPPVRGWLEASMTAHMLIQIPLLLLAGWLAGSHVSRSRRSSWSRSSRASAWNPGGAPGLLLVAAIATTWMIPRALDLAVTSPQAALLKFVTLVIAGAVLRWSWGRSGAPGQAFLIGNVTWMMAVAGLLLRDAPVRVCTSYLTSDQRYAGTGLLLLAAALGVRWFVVWLKMPAPLAVPTR